MNSFGEFAVTLLYCKLPSQTGLQSRAESKVQIRNDSSASRFPILDDDELYCTIHMYMSCLRSFNHLRRALAVRLQYSIVVYIYGHIPVLVKYIQCRVDS